MGRHPHNTALSTLLAEWAARTGDDRLIVEDLACICHTDRTSIFLYTTGRKPCPRLEAKIAEVFQLPIPELRKRLGLPAKQRSKS